MAGEAAHERRQEQQTRARPRAASQPLLANIYMNRFLQAWLDAAAVGEAFRRAHHQLCR